MSFYTLAGLEGAEINDVKKIPAIEATALAHGREEAKKPEEVSVPAFEMGSLEVDLPSFTLQKTELEAGLGLLDILRRVEQFHQ